MAGEARLRLKRLNLSIAALPMTYQYGVLWV
jgi:hypothetical protein